MDIQEQAAEGGHDNTAVLEGEGRHDHLILDYGRVRQGGQEGFF